MHEFSERASASAPLCVVGRADFSTGIGAVAWGAAELFSRTMPTCFFDVTERSAKRSSVSLPNGRVIPTCQRADLKSKKVLFYTDVLWNGHHDLNHLLVPPGGDVLRVAHVAWDSDRLPPEWVDILNTRFDAALFLSPHLERVAASSGVRIGIGTLPLGLDLEELLARAYRPVSPSGKIRFGAVSSFHQRKGTLELIEAFARDYGNHPDAELVIHSNLTLDATYDEAVALVAKNRLDNIILSRCPLGSQELLKLFESFDVFALCSRGEGYSIGPRQALALGKPLVLSAVGPHSELLTAPGVFAIQPTGEIPARYPEIDNREFGRQKKFAVGDIQRALRLAFQFCRSEAAERTAADRKAKAACYSFTALQGAYASTVLGRLNATPAILNSGDAAIRVPVGLTKRAETVLGRFRSRLGHRYKRVVPCRDAGFFSVFNTFFSHLVWDSQDPRCVGVFPDWRVTGLLKRLAGRSPMSFCYGKPEDGNLWLSLFEPLFGASREEMNRNDFLEINSLNPKDECNAVREPLLTYKHADVLYRAPWFQSFRRQYHRHFQEHVRLLPHLQREVDQFCAPFDGRLMIAVHVKHPSHVIEQANDRIAGMADYENMISAILRQEGISEASNDWGIFLATDRDATVDEFLDRFQERVFVFRDVRRTTRRNDEQFASLSREEQRVEGHMIQHLVAADATAWSTRMGWEVVRDAYAMARCDTLLHVVSNISTAVSYMNPALNLIHVDGSAQSLEMLAARRRFSARTWNSREAA
jgi:glycosyltransferase involved in cell wall biosynthesis